MGGRWGVTGGPKEGVMAMERRWGATGGPEEEVMGMGGRWGAIGGPGEGAMGTLRRGLGATEGRLGIWGATEG